MRRREREQLLEQLATLAAQKAGFCSPWSPGPNELSGDKLWCFTRVGVKFETEALCFIYKRRPYRRMFVDFLFSPHSTSFLHKEGLELNALADSLFHLQVRLGANPHSILQPTIPIAEDTDLNNLFDRLSQELEGVVPTVAEHEWSRWSKSHDG